MTLVATFEDRSYTSTRPVELSTFDRWWPTVSAAVSWVVYVGVGSWLLYGLNYAVGDAMARTSMARAMVHSRQPHFGAVGFVWLPWPTLAQTPFMAVLSRLNLELLAGPVSTAIAGAFTVRMLARALQDWGLSRRWVVIFTVVYAINPFTIFYSSNAMSEGWAALFTCAAIIAFLRWCDRPRLQYLPQLGFALAMLCLCRYEGFLVAGVLTIAVALAAPTARLAHALVVLLPTAVVMGFWVAICHILLGDGLYWYKGLVNASDPGPDAGWLPHHRTITTMLPYVLRFSLIVAPILILLVPMIIHREAGEARSRRIAPLTTLVAIGAIYPITVFQNVLSGNGWGSIRYFSPLVLVVTVVAARYANTEREEAPMRWIIVGALVLGLITGWNGLASPKVSAVEAEWLVARKMSNPSDRTFGFPLPLFWQATKYIDDQLDKKDLVAINSDSAFAISMLTRHPRRFAIVEDYDFGALVAAQPTSFTWIVLVHGFTSTTVAPNVSQRGSTASDAGLGEVIATPPAGMMWYRTNNITDGTVSVEFFHLISAD